MGCSSFPTVMLVMLTAANQGFGDQGQPTNTSSTHLRGHASFATSTDVNATGHNASGSSSNSTIEAQSTSAIRGGKIVLGQTGLCMTHENNWAVANRVKASACYGGSDQHWTISGLEIKSYQNADCLDYDVSLVTNGRVNLWGCHGKQNQKWYFPDGEGVIKSAYDGKCLEYNQKDKYVYMAACASWTTDQRWHLE